MLFHSRVQISSFVTTLVFMWIYGSLMMNPIVDGQYETPNNHCGGHFRTVNGTIDFKYNSETNPTPGTPKVCVWTIIPNPFQRYIEVTVNPSTLNCDTDKLGFTWFNESSKASLTSFQWPCNTTPIPMEGSVLVVTLISQSPKDQGFTLTWKGSGFYSRIRFVTAYSSYGKPNVELPYFAAGFMGNSLSTFAFPMGNNTVGYSLQMEIYKARFLYNTTTDCPGVGIPGDEFATKVCSLLLVCNILDAGTMAINSNGIIENEMEINSTNARTFKNKNGLYLIFWGGNRYSAAGGGSIELTYTSVRD